MGARKLTEKYYFTVEGETECWYLEWLQNMINCSDKAGKKVSIDCPAEKNPIKRVKRLSITDKTEICHFFDYEGSTQSDRANFYKTLDNMKQAQTLGKQVKYISGYNNLTFELWIILHKSDCNASLVDKNQYLPMINSIFHENFQGLKEFKKEYNFKRCLRKLDLSDVCDAVRRSEVIMRQNSEKGYSLQSYKGYRFYNENPSLASWEAIKKMLLDCGLI